VIVLAWLVHEALAAAEAPRISVAVVDPRMLVLLGTGTLRGSVRKTWRP
jgi:pyruvate/2-oxoglutarate/acetoin dehydrogenase E1 component